MQKTGPRQTWRESCESVLETGEGRPVSLGFGASSRAVRNTSGNVRGGAGAEVNQSHPGVKTHDKLDIKN